MYSPRVVEQLARFGVECEAFEDDSHAGATNFLGIPWNFSAVPQ
jgi:hypothetical protein